MWDLAYALHGFVPLSADPRWQRADAGHRMRVLVDAYGLDEAGRRGLVALLAPRTRSIYDVLAEQAADGRQPWTRLWDDGHGQAWQADTEYIERRTDEWLRALLG